ncbi:DUF4365 domain-containing protein [Rhodococcus hoagii]|nr:DUF4365 domain-containing protein [Prescottella equi]
MKEELSFAYVHMLASATGLTVGTWSQDYDCKDVTLSSSVDYSPNLYGPTIDIQLKCTGQESAQRKDTIAWALDTRAYRKMSQRNRHSPALFCVLVVPPEPGHWLKYGRDGLLARSHMYWRWGSEFPEVKATQATQTVHLSKSNLLTPSSLLDLMEEASKWQPVLTSSTP